MSLNLGNIFATLSFDITPFKKAIDTVSGQVKQMGTSLSNAFGSNAQSGMNGMNNSMNNLNNSVNRTTKAAEKMGDSFRDVERIVGGIVISQAFYNGIQAIQSGISAVVGFSNNMQTAQVTMENFLGSAEKAEAFVKVMQDFAASTPFSTEQSLDLSKKLMAMGFQANSIRSVMQVLVDTAAGTGGTADELQRIVIALGQINTQGTIMGQEMRQLANANIPVYKILREELGLTGDQLKNIGHLKIPADTAIKALLTGLQKQYAGMSEQLNERTLMGMWANIQDNLLIIGEQVIKAPYEALNKFVRRIYEVLEEARDIVTKSGLGGLFEHFVPKELHTAIRIIVASMKDMITSFGLLYKAVSPVVQLIATWFTQALALAAPIIANITRYIANMANAAMNTSPALRTFVAVIGTIMIANAAATSLMFLWRVMRLGMIATAVAKAVLLLARAVQFLTLVMTKNPIVRIVVIAAAAIMYLASTSAVAAAWIDTLKAKIASLTGIDIGGTLQPVDNKSIEEYMEGFDTDFLGDVNESLKDTGKGIADTGKEADKAGKKVKDKFVASFDELYQVPDQLDDVGDKLDELGDGGIDPGGALDLPKLDFPEIGTPDLSGIKDALKDIPAALPVIPLKFTFEWPNFTPPNFAVVTDVLGTINLALEALRLKFGEFGLGVGTIFDGLGAKFGQWATDGLAPIGDFVTKGLERLAELGSKGGYIITQLVNGIRDGFMDMVNTTGGAVSRWAKGVSDVFADMVGGMSSALAKALNAIGDFVGDANAWFSKLTVDVIGQFNKWTSTVVVTVTAFATAAGNLFKKLGTDITGSITTMATAATAKWNAMVDGLKTKWETVSNSIKTTMVSWATAITTTMTTLGTNLTTNFQKTWDAITKGLGTFTTAAKTTLSTWATNLNKNLNTLMTNMMTNMGKSMDAMGSNFTKGLTGIASNVVLWVTGLSKNSSELFNNLVKNSGAMAKAVGANFAAMAKSSWGTMANFFNGMASTAVNWANSFISTIWNGLKAAWDGVKQLATAAGEAVGAFGAGAKETITNGYKATATWVGEHKTEIIIGAGIVAAVGTAIALAPVTGGWSLAPLLALETGGIVDQHQLVEIGEGNKREAVIPLQNSTYMKPFSAAVANDLAQMLGGMPSESSNQSTQPTMYVQYLIADDRGLKELERRLEIVRLQEDARKGRG
ncbi:hypothetical protein D3C75_232980 [compost metagenome]